MFYTGIDQHKRDSYLATYDADGQFVKQGRVRNTRAALTAYLTTIGRPHRAVVESTGGWYWLADLLGDLDIDLRLAHTTRLKAISAAKVKTDRIDADTLATLLRADLIPEAHMIARDRRGAGDLLRARLRLVAKRASCRNNIARLFEQANVAHPAALDATTRLQVTCYEEQIALLTTQIRTLEQTRVAIELAHSVYHVLRTEEPYNEQFKGTPLTRRKARQWPRLTSPPCLTERRTTSLSLA